MRDRLKKRGKKGDENIYAKGWTNRWHAMGHTNKTPPLANLLGLFRRTPAGVCHESFCFLFPSSGALSDQEPVEKKRQGRKKGWMERENGSNPTPSFLREEVTSDVGEWKGGSRLDGRVSYQPSSPCSLRGSRFYITTSAALKTYISDIPLVSSSEAVAGGVIEPKLIEFVHVFVGAC